MTAEMLKKKIDYCNLQLKKFKKDRALSVFFENAKLGFIHKLERLNETEINKRNSKKNKRS